MTREEFGKAYSEKGGYKKTVRYLRSLGAKVDRAEEIGQAAWVRGWECIAQLRDESCVVEWVNSIARNGLRSRVRRDREVGFDQLPIEPFASPTTSTAAIDMHRALQACRPLQRHLIEATYWDGYSGPELAHRMGKSDGAIHGALSRARRDIKRRMSKTAA
jgi:RNA polymerase sigma factor (sigma-70 family)